jgi:ribonuclease I
MRDKTYYLIFLIACILLVIGIIITIIILSKEDEDAKEDWEKYDCYIFSIFWPPSSCFNKWSGNEKCFSRIRELNDDNNFIVHGLWPSYTSGKYTDVCNKKEDINIDFDNETYTNKLSELWPGLYSSEQTMWNHEYNKHGYCYIKRIGKDPKSDYQIYFDKALSIFENYRLLMEGVLPDTPKGLYNVSKTKFKEFLSESYLKLDPSTYSLRCERNDTKKTDVLNEIWFNYDLDLNLIKNVKSSDNCPENFQLYFSDETRKAVYEKYDFYIFTTIWNPSSCKEKGKECYKKVKSKELNILMIHGLWPSYSTGRFPQWCNIGEDIQVEEYQSELFDIMKNYWIGTYTNNKDFWNHEYNKHGYCYTQLINQTVSNYSFYFQKVVDLYNQYNLKDFLKDIHPGIFAGERKLDKAHILNKLEERYGRGTYTITCIKYENKYYLSEVRLKLDLNFELINLGKTIDNCPEEIYAEFIEVEGPQKQAEGFYKEYDMYFFTILWLGTTCHMKGEQCYENIKVVPKNIFTMHGLWPNLRNGTLADWCNGKNDIEIEIKDETLSEFMNTHYISGYHTNAYFWGHEYNKHGYCYMQRKELDVNDYEYYFNLARKMYLDNDFANIFLDIYKDTIEPGDMQINRKEVENYFDNKGFPKDTYLLVCTNITNKEGVVNPHILEIRIRYDLDFKLLKNETDKSEFDCPELFYAQFL